MKQPKRIHTMEHYLTYCGRVLKQYLKITNDHQQVTCETCKRNLLKEVKP